MLIRAPGTGMLCRVEESLQHSVAPHCSDFMARAVVNHVRHKLARCVLDGSNGLTPAPQPRPSQLAPALLLGAATLCSLTSSPSHLRCSCLALQSTDTVRGRPGPASCRGQGPPGRGRATRSPLPPCDQQSGVPLPAPQASLTGRTPPRPAGRRARVRSSP